MMTGLEISRKILRLQKVVDSPGELCGCRFVDVLWIREVCTGGKIDEHAANLLVGEIGLRTLFQEKKMSTHPA